MSSPSEVIGWECGACAYTNEDATCRDCLACQTRRPVRYAIVAGAMTAATTRTTRVDHRKQACVAALATAGASFYFVRREVGGMVWSAVAQRSCVGKWTCSRSHSRNREVIWRIVSECAKKHKNNRGRRNTMQQNI
jgi:hypothetical protein